MSSHSNLISFFVKIMFEIFENYFQLSSTYLVNSTYPETKFLKVIVTILFVNNDNDLLTRFSCFIFYLSYNSFFFKIEF